MALGTDRRLTGIAVVTVALLAALGVLTFCSGEAGAEDVGSITHEEPPADPVPLGGVLELRDDPPPSEREVIETTPVPEAASEDEILEGVTRVEGRVIVLDQNGDEYPEEDGSLEFVCWDQNTGSHEVVPVRAGRFTIDLKPGIKLSLNAATLGDEPVLPTRDPIEIGETIELRLRRATATVLRVVDADTRIDLGRVIVATASNWDYEDLACPGEHQQMDVVVENGVSPIKLFPEREGHIGIRDRQSYWVSAAGYAWGKIEIDHQNPTDRTLELVRGGELDVSIAGQLFVGEKPPRDELPRLRLRPVVDDSETEAKIRDYLEAAGMSEESPRGKAAADHLRNTLAKPASSRPVLEVMARIDLPVHLTGLRPGAYTVSVERGEWFQNPLVLGSATAIVSAGNRRAVTVAVEPPAERVTVPLAGTLLLPPEWDRSYFSLRFEPLGLVGKTEADTREISISDMTPLDRDGLYRWDAGRVVPARYEVQSYSLDQQWVVDTGPHGNENAEIVVGIPVDVRVQVLDDTTGAPVTDIDVHWNAKRPDGVSGGSLGTAEWNEETQRYEFRAAAGVIEVSAFGSGYRMVGQPVREISPTDRDFTVEVERNCGVVLYLDSDGVTVPWASESEWDIKVENDRGRSVNRGQGSRQDSGHFVVINEPGTITVVIPDQPGFEPVPPFELTIPPRTMVEHRVALRRR